jgi:hypothetical protein
VGAGDRPDLAELTETLEQSRREIELRADWARDTDANLTAIALRQALRAMDASRARFDRLR